MEKLMNLKDMLDKNKKAASELLKMTDTKIVVDTNTEIEESIEDKGNANLSKDQNDPVNAIENIENNIRPASLTAKEVIGEKEEYCCVVSPFLTFKRKNEEIKADARGVYTPKNELQKEHLEYMIKQGHVIKKNFPIFAETNKE